MGKCKLFKTECVASLLGYADPNQAIRKNVDSEWISSMRDVLARVLSPRQDLHFNTNDLNANWISGWCCG